MLHTQTYTEKNYSLQNIKSKTITYKQKTSKTANIQIKKYEKQKVHKYIIEFLLCWLYSWAWVLLTLKY